MKKGVIIRSTGKHYNIKDSSGELLTGIIKGKFKLDGFKLTNPVAVGDIVHYEMEGETAVINAIENRRNYVVRQSPRKMHYLHLMASNIDQALVIATIKEPMLKQGFIDRFLLMTEPYNIPVVILFNKSDLWDEGDINVYNYLKDIYEAIGYVVVRCSMVSGESLDEIQALLKGKTSLISGQSGVGKSSIVNLIVPNIDIKTQDISDYSGKGQHTTTFAEMHDIDENTHVIDTPGIKTLGFNHLEVMDVSHNFREFFIASKDCKFADCSHRNEPHCAVKTAIEEGTISELRYSNYLQILEEIENQNYWERIKDY